MKKIKIKDGYTVEISNTEAYLSHGIFKKRAVRFFTSPCDLIGRRDENGERRLIETEGDAPLSSLTDALIAVSRAWRDEETNEIFLLTNSADTVLNEAAKKAEYIECRREIRGAGDFDAVLFKRHTDR